MGRRAPLPWGTQRVKRDEIKCAWGNREAERGKAGFPKLPSVKAVGRNLAFGANIYWLSDQRLVRNIKLLCCQWV